MVLMVKDVMRLMLWLRLIVHVSCAYGKGCDEAHAVLRLIVHVSCAYGKGCDEAHAVVKAYSTRELCCTKLARVWILGITLCVRRFGESKYKIAH